MQKPTTDPNEKGIMICLRSNQPQFLKVYLKLKAIYLKTEG